jgi:hypothetical protein
MSTSEEPAASIFITYVGRVKMQLGMLQGKCLLRSMEGGEETDLVQASMSDEQEICQKYTYLFRVPISFVTGGRRNCEKGTKEGDHPDQVSFHLNTLVLQGSF